MKKGSITLYLCLVLAALLTLFCGALFSARHAAGRVVLASAAEQGMYSLFSRFDRTLFDEYGILALDGGLGGGELKLGSLQKEAEETVEYLIGDSGAIAGPDNLTHLKKEKGEVTGYVLLTDREGAFLREQISRAVLGRKAVQSVQSVRERVSGYSAQWEALEQEGASVDPEQTEKEYTDLKENPPETPEVPAALRGSSPRAGIRAVLCNAVLTAAEDSGDGNVQEVSENPIETIRQVRKKGILRLVLPKDRSLSSGVIGADRVSRRTLQQGMGIMAEREKAPADKILMAEYLLDCFDDFTEAGKKESQGLQYQVEYAIGGKDSDAGNLKAVVNRLLAMRELSNYLFLMKDPVKQEEIQTAALAISALIGLPVSEPVIAEMLRLCWAYGESVLDLRELLQGGKIPLVKDAASWQLSLNLLVHIQEEITEQHGSENGLTYQWYLRILLAAESEKKLTEAVMDLLEHQMRKQKGRETFRLDNCVVSMTVRFRARQDRLLLLEAERNYHYAE